MTSELRVNTLKDASGNNSVATSTVAEGSAKAWCNLNGTGTAAIRDSFNTASITDNGTGDYSTTNTSAMNNVNYVCNATAGQNSGDQACASNNQASQNRTTTVVRTQVQRSTSDSALDVSVCEVNKMGDLA